MEKTKVTKRNVLEALASYVGDDFNVAVEDVVVTAEDVQDYIATTLEQIDKKNAKAKERNAQKKAESDALKELVYSYIGNELSTISELVAKVNENDGYEEVTNAKIVARLSQLVKDQAIVKEPVKTESGRKIMGYRLNNEETN